MKFGIRNKCRNEVTFEMEDCERGVVGSSLLPTVGNAHPLD